MKSESSPTQDVLVFGAGAIGSTLAAKLWKAGANVGLVARGARFDELSRHGVCYEGEQELFTARPNIVTAHDASPPRLLVLAMKAHQLPAAAGALARLISSETSVLAVVNGIPWWYWTARLPHSRSPVDPDGLLSRALPSSAVLGCVASMAVTSGERGLVAHRGARRLMVSGTNVNLDFCIALLRLAGFDAEGADRIDDEIWDKLMWNAAANALAMATRADTAALLSNPATQEVLIALMHEIAAIASRQGSDVADRITARVETARRAGAFRTSMLQDSQAGRQLETAAIFDAPLTMASLSGVPAPLLKAFRAVVAHWEARSAYKGD